MAWQLGGWNVTGDLDNLLSVMLLSRSCFSPGSWILPTYSLPYWAWYADPQKTVSVKIMWPALFVGEALGGVNEICYMCPCGSLNRNCPGNSVMVAVPPALPVPSCTTQFMAVLIFSGQINNEPSTSEVSLSENISGTSVNRITYGGCFLFLKCPLWPVLSEPCLI